MKIKEFDPLEHKRRSIDFLKELKMLEKKHDCKIPIGYDGAFHVIYNDLYDNFTVKYVMDIETVREYYSEYGND